MTEILSSTQESVIDGRLETLQATVREARERRIEINREVSEAEGALADLLTDGFLDTAMTVEHHQFEEPQRRVVLRGLEGGKMLLQVGDFDDPDVIVLPAQEVNIVSTTPEESDVRYF